jgi:hypothetical protein
MRRERTAGIGGRGQQSQTVNLMVFNVLTDLLEA